MTILILFIFCGVWLPPKTNIDSTSFQCWQSRENSVIMRF